jgi:hypothetical protein
MIDNTKDSFAEEAVGVKPPRSFIMDASILEDQEEHRVLKEDIKLNRLEYVFPEGFNKIDLFEECRALNKVDDFDTMYDLMMQLLEGKPVTINLKNNDGSKTELCVFQVVDRYQNLRAIDVLDEYPSLVVWLTEFIGAQLLKKYPLPGK